MKGKKCIKNAAPSALLITQKNGKRKKKQRYKCLNCGYVFENKSRINPNFHRKRY